MLDFIDVIDLSSEKDEGCHRKVTLAESDQNKDNHLCLLGGISHNTNITFNKTNAQKMIDFCQKIIDNKNGS